MNQLKKPKSFCCPEQFATLKEVKNAICNLSPVEHVKLIKISRFFAKERLNNSIIEANDLLYEAIVKTLDGQRKWNKKVSIVKHLDRVMESDSGHALHHTTQFESESISDDENEQTILFNDPRNRIDAKLEIDKMISIFKNDKLAINLLQLRAQGYLASDIEHEMRIDKTQYEAITKRIRRRLAQYLSSKGHYYEEK